MSQPPPLPAVRRNAQALSDAGDSPAARRLLAQAIEAGRPAYGEDDREVLATAHLLARLHTQADDPAAARRALEEALAAGLRRWGDADPLLLAISFDLGTVAEELGNRHEARRNFTRVATAGPAALGEDHWTVRAAREYLGGAASTGSGASVGEPVAPVRPPVEAAVAPPPAPVPAPAPALTSARYEMPRPQPLSAPPVSTPPISAPPVSAPPVSAPPVSGPPMVSSAAAAAAAAPTQALPTVAPPSAYPVMPNQVLPAYQTISTPPPAAPAPAPAARSYGAVIAAGIAAAAALLAATVVVVVTLLDHQPAQPTAPVADPTGGASGRANTGPEAGGAPPTQLALRDEGTAVTVSWNDPSAGTVSFILAGGRRSQPLGPMATIDPGSTSYTVNGLNARVDYCFTVVAVYSTEVVATSEQVCTTRD
ncbi:fibronectin type III domain-containing protein [Micromonospora pisi]|uniref:fibronectin type III domain-containing protein n=1 Tax=Micromonospora pisi TaxID=589240 RepID=UPI001FECE4F9|nr:fibronectin type III domain-containing protein [Micromonospora pisi]